MAKLPFENISKELKQLLKLKLADFDKNDERYYFARYSEFYGDTMSDACVCLKSQYKRDYYLLRIYKDRDTGHIGHLNTGTHYNPYYKALQNMLIKRNSSVVMLGIDDGVYLGKKTRQWIRFDNGCSMRMCYRNASDKNMVSHYWDVNLENMITKLSPKAKNMLKKNELDCTGIDCIEKACEFILSM